MCVDVCASIFKYSILALARTKTRELERERESDREAVEESVRQRARCSEHESDIMRANRDVIVVLARVACPRHVW